MREDVSGVLSYGLFPLLKIAVPLVVGLEAPTLVGTAEGDEVAEVVVAGTHYDGVVVLIGWLLAHHIFLGDVDAEANGLAFVSHGVFCRHWPVGSPAGAKPFAVAMFGGVLHVDEASDELTAVGIALETDVNCAMTVACVKGVKGGHGYGG